MRFYQIVISDPKSNGYVFVPNYSGVPGFTRVQPGAGIWTYCSLNAGATITTPGGTNPAALQFECDCPVTTFAGPVGNPWFRINNPSLAEIREAKALNGMDIAVFGGMSVGLPLANPAQVGPLVKGVVLQSIGNWQGSMTYLDLYITAGGASPSSNQTTGNPSTASTQPLPNTNDFPANLAFQWPQGAPLLPSLVQCLQVAFPQYSIRGAVSPNLVWSKSTATYFALTVKELAEYLHDASLSVIGGYAPALKNYPGVQISLQNNCWYITDQSTQTAVKTIQFNDLVGQCTWTEPQTVQAVCVLRGDIGVGDTVSLPPGVLVTEFGSASQYSPSGGPNSGVGGSNGSNKMTNGPAGNYWVGVVRHVGNSRGQGGTDWVTTFDCHPLPQNAPVATGVSQLPLLYKPQPA